MPKKEFCTLLYISRQRSKSFRIGCWTAFLLVLSITLLLLTATVGHVKFAKAVHAGWEEWVTDWTNRNTQLGLVKIREELAQADLKLARIFESNDRIRQVYDMAPVSSEARQVGIGGADIESGDNAFLRRIDRQISFEKENLRTTAFELAKRLKFFEHRPMVAPTTGRVTSDFGVRVHPVLEKTMFHEGIDIANVIGTPIYATASGIVSKVSYDRYAGRYIQISHGYGYKTCYAHMHDIYVEVGEKISRYTEIGTVGRTGRTTGPHIHYEVRHRNRALNPRVFMLPRDQSVD